jgi:protein-S-isoprenylcysteine O-methyltransferase
MPIPSAAILAGAVYFLSESALTLRRRAARNQASGDKGSLPVIWGVTFAAVTAAYIAAGRLGAADVPMLRAVPAIGLAVFGLGVLLRWYAIIHLGRFFTVNVAIADDHRLIDTGPYRWLRHPSYTGWLMVVTGLGLCLGNVVSLAILVVATLGLILWRIGLEEKALRAAFGEAYDAYARKTARLVPLVF